MKYILTILLLLTSLSQNFAQQITLDDYHRVDSLYLNNNRIYNTMLSQWWVEDSSILIYSTRDKQQGIVYYKVDAQTAKRSTLFDSKQLALALKQKLEGKDIDHRNLTLQDCTLAEDMRSVEFRYAAKQWSYNPKKNQLTTMDSPEEKEWKATTLKTKKRVESPDKAWVAYNEDNNIYLENLESNDITQLTFDGSFTHYYTNKIYWSPDSKKVVAMKWHEAEMRRIPLIRSAPEGQLQPILEWRNYRKPGDEMDISTPYLFDVATQKSVAIDLGGYLNQYWLRFSSWGKDSRSFTFEFNERGHQRYDVVRVDANSGCLKPIISEHYPESFVHYYGNFRHDTKQDDEIIWISERDGYRHLYLFDKNSGEIKNQITKGEWVVREVLRVDDDKREILFLGSGVNQGEDPYNLHLYRINFDGSNLTSLTEQDANHTIDFSDDYRYFVDKFSRPDMPQQSLLRATSNGSVVAELERCDISELLATGWSMPEVFSAKGRDGVTDIWGTIFRPTNFSPDKTYPVIEYIYAGPHDSHVLKDFFAYYRFSALADLGFIIVSIDGMGTANRSKAFHDVCWRNLKDAGFPDRKLWIKAAAKEHPELDITNVGIFGYSAGGQNALAALLFHNDFYKVAIAACGCHDNRMDKIWWNEQWMGYPIGQWYSESSNVDNAHLLKGKLMLINGELDDNVDPTSTLQVVDKLVKAGKHFEMLYMPGYGHSLGGKYEMRRFQDFFVRNILHQDAPDFNE